MGVFLGRHLNLFLFIFLISPVFIGFRSGSLVFDVNVFNPSVIPSIPIGTIFLFLLFNFKYFDNIISPFIILLFCLLFAFLLYFSSLIKGFAYLIALVSCGLAYTVGKYSSQLIGHNKVINNFYFSLIFIFFTKLFFDLIAGEYFSDFFIVDSVKIYNFYDYFPLFFLLMACASVLISNRYLSLLAFVITFFVFFTDSRFYQISVPLFYFLYFARIYRLTFPLVLFSSFVLLLLSTFLLILFFEDLNDASLIERVSHWLNFFSSFTLKDIIFPAYNVYRQFLNFGSLHNEIIDIYSYFGFFSFFIFYKCLQVLRCIDFHFYPVIKIFSFIMFLGVMFQNNFSHLWSGVLIFFVFGSFATHTR